MYGTDFTSIINSIDHENQRSISSFWAGPTSQTEAHRAAHRSPTKWRIFRYLTATTIVQLNNPLSANSGKIQLRELYSIKSLKNRENW
jgi:hypothetical protein